MSFERYIRILKTRKKRLTPGRVNIIKFFCQSSSPLSAEKLIRKTGLNKTSVYREIIFLIHEGIIQDVDFGDGKKRYELKDLKHHHHLVCLKCGYVSDIALKENLGHEEERIKQYLHFKIVKHNLEFFGYCSHCHP